VTVTTRTFGYACLVHIPGLLPATRANSSRSGSEPSRWRRLGMPPEVGTPTGHPSTATSPGAGQPRGGLLTVIVGEQRHGHREVHHDMRWQLSIRTLSLLARRHRVVDRNKRHRAVSIPSGSGLSNGVSSHSSILSHKP
jgi:hypothetical protein